MEHPKLQPREGEEVAVGVRDALGERMGVDALPIR